MSAPAPVDPEVAAKLAGLIDRYRLNETARGRLATLLHLIGANDHAPTTVRDPVRAVDEHLADSLVALEQPEIRDAARIADLGAGAGFPGLPLAIALPASEVSLVESNARKASFIAAAIKACVLPNARAVNARIESWREGGSAFEAVTARAVGPFDVVAEYAAPLLQVGGHLIVWRGRRNPEEEAGAAAAAGQLGLRILEPRQVQPFPAAENRYLHLMLKVMETPARFPRREGVARKRPLGGPMPRRGPAV